MSTSSTTSSTTSSLLSTLANVAATTASGSASTSTSGPLITAGQLNVSQLVSELMTIQEIPLTQLQTQASGVQSKLSAYGQEQSALSALQTASQALSLPSAFQAAGATTTGSGVSAVVSGTPANGTYNIGVTSLASAQSIASASVSSSSATLGTGTLVIQPGTLSGSSFTANASATPITVTIDSSNDTLSGIAAAINSAAGGTVNASVVTDANGTSQLVMSSANTGSANAFSVSASSGLSQFGFTPGATGAGMTQTQGAADAQFSVNGLNLTSASNSVTTAVSGLTLNLTQAPAAGGSPLQSQVTVAADPTAITSTVNSFISAYNSLITTTNSLTSYNSTTNTASVLTGDPSTGNVVRQLQGILASQTTASGTTSANSWLAEIGVSTNSDGTLTLNSSKFQQALAANPSAVSAMFTSAAGTGSQQGFAVQISNAVSQMIGPTGAIGAAQASLQSQLSYINTKEGLMQTQLAQKQAALTQEYSKLNAALSAAQAEQVSLANELAGLPGG